MIPTFTHRFADLPEFAQLDSAVEVLTGRPLDLKERVFDPRGAGEIRYRSRCPELEATRIRRLGNQVDCAAPVYLEGDRSPRFWLFAGPISIRSDSRLPTEEPTVFSVEQLLSVGAQLLEFAAVRDGIDLDPAPDAVQEALAILRMRSRRPLQITEVAAEIGVSPNHLSTLLSRHTGQTFRDHLSLLRLHDACQLIQVNPERRLSEVAAVAGFQSISQFNRTFKRMLGRSPGEYRDGQMRPGTASMRSLAGVAAAC